MPAQTIDDIMLNLDTIVAADRSADKRIAYFACLYRHVTAAIQAGITAGNVFDDNARMEHLAVTFANRYFAALDAWSGTGNTPTQAWQLAFETARSPKPIVMQHLFLAMNAHINVNLGMAVAQTSPGDLSGLHKDFDTMNNILATLVPHVEGDLEHVWPILKIIHRLAHGDEDEMLSFSMQVARVSAWDAAQKLAPLDAARQAVEIQQLDAAAVELGKAILHSGFPLNLLIALFHRLQEGTIPQIIDALIDFRLQQDVINDWMADATQRSVTQG